MYFIISVNRNLYTEDSLIQFGLTNAGGVNTTAGSWNHIMAPGSTSTQQTRDGGDTSGAPPPIKPATGQPSDYDGRGTTITATSEGETDPKQSLYLDPEVKIQMYKSQNAVLKKATPYAVGIFYRVFKESYTET